MKEVKHSDQFPHMWMSSLVLEEKASQKKTGSKRKLKTILISKEQ